MKKRLLLIIMIIVLVSSTAAFGQAKPSKKKPVKKRKVTVTVSKKKALVKKAPIIKAPMKLPVTVPMPPVKKPPEKGTNPGITTNNVPYNVVFDLSTISQTYAGYLNQLRENRGFFFMKDDNNGYLFSILSGQKPTGGYAIKIVSVQDVEGVTTVTVDERVPAKDEIVNMMVTYPMVTISLNQVNDKIKVVNTNGEEYQLLKVNN